MLATATLLPGSESGGFGQNDVASPVFLAWSKQESAGRMLEQSLAALAPIALLALDLTGRERRIERRYGAHWYGGPVAEAARLKRVARRTRGGGTRQHGVSVAVGM